MKKLLATAISLAAQKFEGKFDKAGEPYIMHCLNVMDQMPKDRADLRIAAVLHDIVEDTLVTLKDLELMGFPKDIVTSIDYLTHRKGVTYDAYIKRVATDDMARVVKLADLHHNSDITRLKGLRDIDFKRMEKYHRAYEYLRY